MKMINVFRMMSEHQDPILSGLINKLGIASISIGGASAVSKVAVETKNEAWLTITDVAGIVSIIGGFVFIIKLIVDMYYTRKKDRREENVKNKDE
jgi:high-affinity nickel permease